MTDRDTSVGPRALIILLLMPFFFSTNAVFGRIAVADSGPWTLAFLRWALCFLLLLPFALKYRTRALRDLRRNWGVIAILGFLGMCICGGLYYVALERTTATNATLIYTATPVIIILLESLFRGRGMTVREIGGIGIAVFGVVVIVTAGELIRLLRLELNVGDGLVALAAIAWAVYSVIFKRDSLTSIPSITLFAAICFAGAVSLFPFAIVEMASRDALPTRIGTWAALSGIVLFASLLSFTAYQYGVRVVGPSLTGIFLYLLPFYGVLLAILILGEELQGYHLAGCALVLGGVMLATLPASVLRRAS